MDAVLAIDVCASLCDFAAQSLTAAQFITAALSLTA